MNEKVFYRFVEFAGKLSDYDLPHEAFKLIALGKYTTQTLGETKTRRLSDSFRYLVSSTSQLFDEELLGTSYYLLTKEKLEPAIASDLKCIYYQHKDCSPFENAVLLHLEIENKNLKSKTEYALMISSFCLIQRGYSPLIIYDSDKEEYLQNVAKRDEPNLYNQFLMLEHQTRMTLEEQARPFSETIGGVVEAIKANKNTLTQKYRIKRMLLYGSVAKNTVTPVSDVDFLVLLDDSLLVYEKNELLSQCKAFLETKIKATVDLLEYGYSMDHMELVEAGKALTLF